MTENEIRLTKRLQEGKALCIAECEKECTEGYYECHKCKPFADVLVKLAEYEDIGTVEELQKLKGVITDFPLDCGSPIKSIAEIWNQLKKYLAIGTIEYFRDLKEKNEPKKPNQVSKAMDKDKFVGLIGRCPNCGSIVAEDNLVCEDCFQVLDWSE